MDVAKDAVCIIENKATDRGLQIRTEFDLPLPQTIITDPTRLKQILLNLCANAVKFTETGTVTISMSFDEQKKQMIFSVRDTGIGMTPEQVSKVFSPFQQADKSTTRFYGGTGLGLSISKQLARRLGGDIECRSEVGKGTTFIVSIHSGDQQPTQWITEPPALTDACQNAIAQKVTPQLSGSILLAEDTPDIRVLITLYLQKAGLNVVAVNNGFEAVREASRHLFDLVLMDMQMPIMDGLTAIRQLRTQGLNTPIVALTANATKEDKRRCLSAGADDFLVKPVDVRLFYQLLSQYLSAKPPADTSELTATVTSDKQPSKVPPKQKADDYEQEMQRLIHGFVNRLPQAVNEITTYYRQKQWQELLSSSHRLKGAGGAFGYPELSEISKNIMEKVNQHHHNELKELIDSLNQRCQQISKKAG